MNKTSILFVCLGNICRSPVAEGVFRQKIAEAGLAEQVSIDSAGTAAWHVGKAPDSRMISAARERGYDLSALRARQAITSDFHEFDHILAMDHENLANLQAIEPHNPKAQLSLFLSYAEGVAEEAVPDPYFGGTEGFYHVIDLVEAASDGLIKSLNLTAIPE